MVGTIFESIFCIWIFYVIFRIFILYEPDSHWNQCSKSCFNKIKYWIIYNVSVSIEAIARIARNLKSQWICRKKNICANTLMFLELFNNSIFILILWTMLEFIPSTNSTYEHFICISTVNIISVDHDILFHFLVPFWPFSFVCFFVGFNKFFHGILLCCTMIWSICVRRTLVKLDHLNV